MLKNAAVIALLAIMAAAILVHELLVLLSGGDAIAPVSLFVAAASASLAAFLTFALRVELRSAGGIIRPVPKPAADLSAFMLLWSMLFGSFLVVAVGALAVVAPAVALAKNGWPATVEFYRSGLLSLSATVSRGVVASSFAGALVMYAAGKLGVLKREA
jgi:hypothetical protein